MPWTYFIGANLWYDYAPYVTFIIAYSCGQSYKALTIVIYDPRVIIWSIFKSGTTLES